MDTHERFKTVFEIHFLEFQDDRNENKYIIFVKIMIIFNKTLCIKGCTYIIHISKYFQSTVFLSNKHTVF